MTPDMVPTEVAAPGNGAVPLAAPLATCILAELPTDVHHYIHGLEQRIFALEAEQKRFGENIIKMGKFFFDSPQGKMILIAFPKAMQDGLRDFFAGK